MHKIVSNEEWLAARKSFLAKEKEFTRLRDELARQRRELPWVKVEKAYVFDGPDGKESLSDLFAGREPAHRLPLHVRPGLERGLPQLLVLGRQLQRHRRAPGAPRRVVGRDLAGAAGEAGSLQEAHGLELQVGLLARQRLQPRLSRLLHARGAEDGGLQLRSRADLAPSRGARRQRLRQGRGRATSSTPTPATRAGSTCSTAPISCSTSSPRDATSRACPTRWRGCAATTNTSEGARGQTPRYAASICEGIAARGLTPSPPKGERHEALLFSAVAQHLEGPRHRPSDRRAAGARDRRPDQGRTDASPSTWR